MRELPLYGTLVAGALTIPRLTTLRTEVSGWMVYKQGSLGGVPDKDAGSPGKGDLPSARDWHICRRRHAPRCSRGRSDYLSMFLISD